VRFSLTKLIGSNIFGYERKFLSYKLYNFFKIISRSSGIDDKGSGIALKVPIRVYGINKPSFFPYLLKEP